MNKALSSAARREYIRVGSASASLLTKAAEESALFMPLAVTSTSLGSFNTNLMTPAGVDFFRILGTASDVWLLQISER